MSTALETRNRETGQHRCSRNNKTVAGNSCKEVAATIEVNAALYVDKSIWTDTGRSIQGWQTFEVVSAHSGKTYTLCLSPRKGEYTCNCQAPLDCWHLYAFREYFLPMIRATRAASLAPPAPVSPFFVPPVRRANMSVMAHDDFDGPAVPALADRRPTPSKIEHLYTEGLR